MTTAEKLVHHANTALDIAYTAVGVGATFFPEKLCENGIEEYLPALSTATNIINIAMPVITVAVDSNVSFKPLTATVFREGL